MHRFSFVTFCGLFIFVLVAQLYLSARDASLVSSKEEQPRSSVVAVEASALSVTSQPLVSTTTDSFLQPVIDSVSTTQKVVKESSEARRSSLTVKENTEPSASNSSVKHNAKINPLTSQKITTDLSQVLTEDHVTETFLASDVSIDLVQSSRWLVPTHAPIVSSFDKKGQFLKGSASVRFGSSKGDDIIAVEAGIVTFVGTVVGETFVTITHSDELRSTYSSVDQTVVNKGDKVLAGQKIATASGELGLTARDAAGLYLNPELFFPK